MRKLRKKTAALLKDRKGNMMPLVVAVTICMLIIILGVAGLGGKKNGYGIVIGNGKQVPIRKSVRKTVKAVMDIGKMRESTWTKAGGSLAWTDIRHPYQQQWTLLRMPNPLLQQLPLSRVAMV